MVEFRLPDLGEGIREAEILKWHAEPGAAIRADQPLVDVETDKAAVTIPAPAGGTLVQRAGEVGQTVIVGSVLVVIDDGVAAAVAPLGGPPASAPPEPSRMVAANAAPPDASRPVPAAPATRRLARELGVDLRAVTPTGPAGRVLDEDVRRAAAAVSPEVGPPVHRAVPASADAVASRGGGGGSPIPFLDLEPLPDFARWGPVDVIPLRSVRRKVARRMTTSKILAPHVAHADEADVTAIERIRARLNEGADREGRPRLTALAFVVRAVAAGLVEMPDLNASLDPFAEAIVRKRYVNVGIAADTDRGLLVPVLRDADRKSVDRIAAELAGLVARARDGSIAPEEMQGGTFTITNVGRFSGTFVLPAINYPEVAILGMGRIEEKPVVRDGQIVARTILPLALSFDHRVVDGAQAARFVSGLVRRLSDPDRFLVGI